MEEDAPFEYQISTGDAKSWFDAVRTCKVIDTIGTFNRLEVHVLYIPSILYQAPRGGLFISCTFEMDGLFKRRYTAFKTTRGRCQFSNWRSHSGKSKPDEP